MKLPSYNTLSNQSFLFPLTEPFFPIQVPQADSYSEQSLLVGPGTSPFPSEQFHDHIIQTCLQYPTKYQTTIKNLLRCERFKLVSICTTNPEHNVKNLGHCFNRYCNHEGCATMRQIKASTRMKKKFKNIWSPRWYHCSIGTNRTDDKKYMDKVIGKYLRKLRYRGFKCWYVKTFDVSKKYVDPWYHYHLAFLPDNKFKSPTHFMKLSKALLNKIDPTFCFNNIGFRSKKNIISYFAKRCSGRLGHQKEGYYYYSDFFEPLAFLQRFYRSRQLTYHFPEGLVNKDVPHPANLKCPVCNDPMEYSHTELIEALLGGKLPSVT